LEERCLIFAQKEKEKKIPEKNQNIIQNHLLLGFWIWTLEIGSFEVMDFRV